MGAEKLEAGGRHIFLPLSFCLDSAHLARLSREVFSEPVRAVANPKSRAAGGDLVRSGAEIWGHPLSCNAPKLPVFTICRILKPSTFSLMGGRFLLFLEIVLREIRYVINEPGRKQDPFVIVTTLFESEQGKQEITTDDIAELFGFRWNSELDIRSIKPHLNLHHLRCKSPEMVRREFWTTILAYNAIRTTAACSAALNNVSPRRISFVGTCQFVLSAWDLMASGLMAIETLLGYCLIRLKQISKCIVGNRPGRFEPRVLKKRQKNYNLMMQPRNDLKIRLAKGDNSFETK